MEGREGVDGWREGGREGEGVLTSNAQDQVVTLDQIFFFDLFLFDLSWTLPRLLRSFLSALDFSLPRQAGRSSRRPLIPCVSSSFERPELFGDFTVGDLISIGMRWRR